MALSISDGYLSFATPLIETTLTLELLNQHAVGGVLHLSKNGNQPSPIMSLPSPVLQTHFSSNLTFSQIQRISDQDLLWEDIDLENIKNEIDLNLESNASIRSAISLQHFLFTHCGGWSNTFG